MSSRAMCATSRAPPSPALAAPCRWPRGQPVRWPSIRRSGRKVRHRSRICREERWSCGRQRTAASILRCAGQGRTQATYVSTISDTLSEQYVLPRVFPKQRSRSGWVTLIYRLQKSIRHSILKMPMQRRFQKHLPKSQVLSLRRLISRFLYVCSYNDFSRSVLMILTCLPTLYTAILHVGHIHILMFWEYSAILCRFVCIK